MTVKVDWKFWLALMLTLAGVLVPVWLWKADRASHALNFRQLSQTSLQPAGSAESLDLTISVENIELQQPYLTVFELTNSGTRPVVSSDFEAPIELIPEDETTVIRAMVENVTPPDLAPQLSTEENRIELQPMLLNPGDTITLAILTAGAIPKFTTRARIFGVQSVPIVDVNENELSTNALAVIILISALSFLSANIVFSEWPYKSLSLRPRAAFIAFGVSMIPAVSGLVLFLDAFSINGFWPLAGGALVGIIATQRLVGWINRPFKKAPKKSKIATQDSDDN